MDVILWNLQNILWIIFKVMKEGISIPRPMCLIAGVIIILTLPPSSPKTHFNIESLHPTSMIGSYSCWTTIILKAWELDWTLYADRFFLNYLRSNGTIVTSCPIIISAFLTPRHLKLSMNFLILHIKKLWKLLRLRQDFNPFSFHLPYPFHASR